MRRSIVQQFRVIPLDLTGIIAFDAVRERAGSIHVGYRRENPELSRIAMRQSQEIRSKTISMGKGF
jgi:hypothetical protein